MVNYANGKVYKIESSLGDKIYIGSTTKAQLSQRMTAHRCSYKRWKAGTQTTITTSFLLFEEYGVENCQIVLLEDCPCESKDQLSAREAHYIRTLACVNKLIPLRTEAEWYQDNRDEILEQRKTYREANRAEILEHQKVYREANRTVLNEKQRARYHANRESINEQGRARYHARIIDDAHRAAINEKKRERYHAMNDDAHRAVINERQRARRRAKKDQIKI